MQILYAWTVWQSPAWAGVAASHCCVTDFLQPGQLINYAAMLTSLVRLSLKSELHMLRPITESACMHKWQWASFVSGVAWKCRHWNMLRPKIYWTKRQQNLAKFQNFEKFNIIQICTDVTVLLHSIWELLSNTLFAFTFDYMYFFQFLPVSSSFFHFLPEETGRNTFFPVSSILPGRNLFLPKVSEPCLGDTIHTGPNGACYTKAQVQINADPKWTCKVQFVCGFA